MHARVFNSLEEARDFKSRTCRSLWYGSMTRTSHSQRLYKLVLTWEIFTQSSLAALEYLQIPRHPLTSACINLIIHARTSHMLVCANCYSFSFMVFTFCWTYCLRDDRTSKTSGSLECHASWLVVV